MTHEKRDWLKRVNEAMFGPVCAHAWSDWWCREYHVREVRICRRCGGAEERPVTVNDAMTQLGPVPTQSKVDEWTREYDVSASRVYHRYSRDDKG